MPLLADPELPPSYDSELLWQFAVSEIDSQSRHGDAWRKGLGTRVSEILRRGGRFDLSDADWRLIQSVLLHVRGWYVQTLLAVAPTWSHSEIRVSEIGNVRLIRHAPFQAIAPSLRIAEFVDALDRGVDTPGDRFAWRYVRLRPAFDWGRVRGCPILVSKSLTGPFVELDGLTRMSILYSRWKHGEPVPDRIPVLVGQSDNLDAWSHF